MEFYKNKLLSNKKQQYKKYDLRNIKSLVCL